MGREIPFEKLGDEHLLNILKFCRRQAREGVMVMNFWGGTTKKTGRDVLVAYNYATLKELAQQRKLI